MQVQPFELERWQSIWENKVEMNISESGVHPLTTAELVPDLDVLRAVLDVRLGYPQTNGSEELRTRIAELYPGARMENVLVTCGGSEANYISTWALVEPGDEVVFMLPNYMQIAGLAPAFGATVKPLWLRENLEWGIDPGDLPLLITPKTRLIAVCHPNNPTGSMLPYEEVARLRHRLISPFVQGNGSADEVRPQRNPRTRDIPPEHVEARVPIVELGIVACFEARAADPQGLHVVAELGANDGRRHMRAVRNTLRGAELAAQRPFASQGRHDDAC